MIVLYKTFAKHLYKNKKNWIKRLLYDTSHLRYPAANTLVLVHPPQSSKEGYTTFTPIHIWKKLYKPYL